MRKSRFLLTFCLVGAVLSGCGSSGGSEPAASTPPRETIPDVAAAPACTDAFGGSSPVTREVLDGPCDDNGELVYAGAAFYDCADGRTLAWNDYGWGYVGENWTGHEAGAEQVAPAPAREACEP